MSADHRPGDNISYTLKEMVTVPPTNIERHDSSGNHEVKVSVILPARNEEAYLAASLAAIQAQDYGEAYEVIVVDNGSTDRTAEIATEMGARVVHEPEAGLPRAREAGRNAACGDILVYIDADTHIPRNFLTRVTTAFAREPHAASVTSPVRFYDGDWSANIFIFCYFFFYRILNFLRIVDFVFGGTFALRRDAIERIGGFDVSIAFYGEDADLTKRIKREGRIRYLGGLYSLTSARRYQRQGTFTTVWHYTVNYFSVLFCNHPYAGQRRRRTQHAIRWGTVLFLMFALFLYAFAFPESELFGKVVYKMNSPQKVVALTFDDGPNGAVTLALLRVLAEEQVKATFFVTGRNVDRYPELAARIVNDGHTIGNHSYDHSWSLPFQSRKMVMSEVHRADDAIYRATHIHTNLFRPPHGLRTPWMLSAIRSEGYAVVMWDDMTEDFLGNTNAKSLAARTLKQVRPNSIIAMDDGSSFRQGTSAQNSAEALRIIIHELKRQHYTFVTLNGTE